MKRILHCDLNNFFASVEELKNSELKKIPMVVSGDPNRRNGIILAKNNLAKKYGIYTPETVASAKAKCPNLVFVEPHYEDYIKYSKLVNKIYLRYTDKVEPFSIDESYLDITDSMNLFGSAYEIADKIRNEVKKELGLTISIGISFNKRLAKMGSDMKKPDAITELYENNYKEKIYKLPVSNMLFCGKVTVQELKKLRIETIGDLAYCNKDILIKKFGKLGLELYENANGIDRDEVKKYNDLYIPKSISKGTTLKNDTDDINILEIICKELSNKVVSKLRYQDLKCSIVCVSIKNSNFVTVSKQRQIPLTSSYQEILVYAIDILKEMVVEGVLIRSLTISVSGIIKKDSEETNLFEMEEKNNADFIKKEKIATAKNILDSLKDKNKNLQIGIL